MNFSIKIISLEIFAKDNKIINSLIKKHNRIYELYKDIRNKIAHFLSTYVQLSEDPKDAKIMLFRKRENKNWRNDLRCYEEFSS